jgi:hypothetical protein
MELKSVNISSIKPSVYNPPVRTTSSSSITGLREDIKQRGLIEPLTIDKNNVLINGHRRFRCIVELNWKKVNVIQHDIEQTVTDEYFLSTNEHTLRMNGAQYLWRYMNKAIIPEKYLERYIKPLEKWLGKKAAWGIFRELIKRNLSPAGIHTVMRLYRDYTGRSTQLQMKKFVYYMLYVESIMKTKHAMYNFIPKKQLIKCVENRKKLQPTYVKPGNLKLDKVA